MNNQEIRLENVLEVFEIEVTQICGGIVHLFMKDSQSRESYGEKPASEFPVTKGRTIAEGDKYRFTVFEKEGITDGRLEYISSREFATAEEMEKIRADLNKKLPDKILVDD